MRRRPPLTSLVAISLSLALAACGRDTKPVEKVFRGFMDASLSYDIAAMQRLLSDQARALVTPESAAAQPMPVARLIMSRATYEIRAIAVEADSATVDYDMVLPDVERFIGRMTEIYRSTPPGQATNEFLYQQLEKMLAEPNLPVIRRQNRMNLVLAGNDWRVEPTAEQLRRMKQPSSPAGGP